MDEPISQLPLLSQRPVDVLATPQGTLRLWRPAPMIVVGQFSGVFADGHAAMIEALVLRTTSEDGNSVTFHDWEHMTDYDPSARARLTKLKLETTRLGNKASVIASARNVLLALEAAAVAAKNLIIFKSRPPFEASLRQALRAAGVRG
jgi:hypothetical protein